MSEDEPEAGKTAGDDAGGADEGPDRRGGGTGNAGGTDLHAMAMVAAAVHLMRGTRIGWLEKVASDIPVAIRAETGGPGDDIGLELADGGTVEIQCKKNLQRGSDLWDALDAMIDGIAKGTIAHAVLAVAPDSSGTIRNDLAADIIKIGQGVEDHLSNIGSEWLKRLKASARSPGHCANIRIQTLDLLESQGGDRRNAVDTLRAICANPERAEDALNLMFSDAVALMRSRGRWTLPSLVTLLRSLGITLREDNTPAGIATKLTRWTEITRGSFSLPAGSSMLPIEAMLPARLVAIPRTGPQDPDASAALDRYHSRSGEALDSNVFDGQWTGRYRRLNVIVAGPGIGKSTLANRLAWEFARDGVPVLAVPFKRIAAAMKAGAPFDVALEQHGLDGSGIDPARIRYAQLAQLVVVADGLDEAGLLHDQVAEGLVAYAAGHPQATIIVTTRPIGYETARLAEWRHYRLEPPIETEGPENLGRLLATSRGLDLADAGCLKEAKRELASTPARDAIVASPLLLGMSATLIIQNERLPATKPEIYEAMIALFEGRDNAAAAAQLTSLEAARTLDIIGWELTDKPLLTWQHLEVAGCCHLASDLKQPPLAVAQLFSRGFAHWERAGIVERVHHAGTQLVTFVHKTFGEFAAARFLCRMGKDQLRIEMERMIDLPSLGEVVSFAGTLGLGNDLAQLYVDRRGDGAEGQFELALALAADRDTHVDDAKTIELALIAFHIAATDADDRFSIGGALSVLAKARSNIVGPLAQSRLDDPDEVVKLVAWAAAIAAGEAYHDRSRLEQVLRGFVNLSLGDEPRTPIGIRANLHGKDIDLVQSVAIAALKAKPVDEMADFVATNLSDRPFTNIGFYASVRAVLIANGIKPPASPWEFSPKENSIPTTRIVADPDDRWNRSSNRAMRALAIAVAGNAPESRDTNLSPKHGYPEFSALFELVGIGSTEASDVLKWEGAYDEAAVAEAIRGLVAVSRIDASQLAVEAREIAGRLESEPHRNVFFIKLSHPDIPAPEWRDAATLQLDRDRLEGAFSHGSTWLMAVAANLLAVMPSTEADCARLLEKAHGVSLGYAVQVVALHVDKLVWRDLLLDRLRAGLDNGTEHILAALAESDVSLVSSVGETVAAAIRSGNDRVVEAAAKLGVRWLEAGGTIDADTAKSAYRDSRSREAAAKGGWLVTEIRAELLNLLIASGSLDDALLREAISDGSSKARETAKQEAAARGLSIV
jgi:hypothetical protein